MGGLINGAVGTAKGLLGGGGGPSYNAVPLDAGTEALINKDVNQVTNQSPGQLAAATNQAGTNAAKAFSGGPGTQNASSTGGDPAMLQAIKNQYSGLASKDINQLQRQNQSQAQVEQGQQLSEFAKTALAQQQVMTQNYTDLMNAQNANTEARAGMITSLINLGTQGMIMNKTMGDKGLANAKSQYYDPANYE